MQTKRLYRNRSNAVFGGVASGLAGYFNLDPLVVRILFVLMFFIGGGGLLLYIALWIFVPEDPNAYQSFYNAQTMENETNFNQDTQQPGKEPWRDPIKSKNSGNLIGGLILITLGVLFLLDRFLPRIDFGDLWPVLLIVAGIAILSGNIGKSKSE